MYFFIQAGEHILLHEFPDDARYIVLPSTQHNITSDTMSTGGKVKVNILCILFICSDASFSNDYATLYVRNGHWWPSKDAKALLFNVLYLFIYARINTLLHEIINVARHFCTVNNTTSHRLVPTCQQTQRCFTLQYTSVYSDCIYLVHWRPISNDHICSSSILWRLISSGDDYSFHLCDYKNSRINVQCLYLHNFFGGFEEDKTLATILMTLFILCIYSFRPEYILFCTSSRM